MEESIILKDDIYHPYWKNIIKSYFKANGFVKHQLDSFNDFIENGIQKILNEIGPIEIKTSKDSRGGEATYIFEFGEISIKKPLIREQDGTTNVLYPQEARNRNLTYHSSLYCDIKVTTIKNDEKIVKVSKEQLGYIPIMVKSKFCLLYGKTEKECKDLGECIYDEGGYFIVNGNEKAIVAQERMPNNIVYCFYKKPPSKIIWQAEIRSQFEYHIKTTSTFYIRIFSKGSRSLTGNNPTFTDIDGIRTQITYIKQDIPIMFVFYALGYCKKNEIIDIITNSSIPNDNNTNTEYFKNILKFLRCSFDEADEIIKEETSNDEVIINPTELQEFCLDYIGKKGSTVYNTKSERIKYAIQIINRELLPHLNLKYEDIFKQELQITKTKAHFIGYMINKLYLSYLGILKENDRDHLANKRLDLTGNLLTSLFKSIFKRLYKEAKVNLTKSIESNNSFDLVNNIKSKSITNDIKYALSTGNWGRQTGGTPPKTGVAQQLNRLTFSSALSHLRRLNTPLNREGKQAKPRQLHPTNFSYVCLVETPEGQACVSVDTTVLLSDGSLKYIKDIENVFSDTTIFSIDTESKKIEPTNIIAFQNYDTIEYNHKILKITTASGRNITVTDDHQFSVPYDTFKEASKLKINDKVLIFPTKINTLNNVVNDTVILDKENYIKKLKEFGVSDNIIMNDIYELEKMNLLPLINNDKRINTIASLIGYCNTNGHISKSTNLFIGGYNEDINYLIEDIYKIGFTTTNLCNYKSFICINNTLPRLLISLGSIIGKNNVKYSEVPQFLKYCNISTKAAYLSGLFGGNYNSSVLSIKKNKSKINAPSFKYIKVKSLEINLIEYLENIKTLLLEFGIQSIIKKKINKHDLSIYKLYINNNFENIIKFIDNIEYKWCTKKQYNMQITGEYIRYLEYYKNTQDKHKLVNIPLKRVDNIDNLNTQKYYIEWQDFLTETSADFNTGTLYDKIVDIQHINNEQCPRVMDLTTESDNHTFITNGFVTHNCGLLRNLAITCHMSIGSEKTFIILKRFLNKYTSDKFIETREMATEVPLYKVFLDGAWVVSVDDNMVLFLVNKLKKFRRNLMISFDTCICLDKEAKELNIFTGSGRFCRPLLVVENLHLLNEDTKNDSWNDLLYKGIIEYIDIAEEEELMIAIDLRQLRKDPQLYTHLEIHPSVMLGVCASTIPFSEHNQSPRNIYQSLHPDTLVTMANGTQKPIGDVKIGDMVVTFDHNTLSRSYSKVINQYIKPSENAMYKITTISGREIIATDNHSFYTDEGFKEVKYFDENTLIGIDLGNRKQLSVEGKIKIIDKEQFIQTCKKYKTLRQSTIDKYLKELNKWFDYIDIDKVIILAGIIGYILSDGNIYVANGSDNKVSFYHSSEEGAINLINDMVYLGFEKVNINEKNMDNPREITQTTYNTYYYGYFPLMLETLGITVDTRTTQNSLIPDFILNGSKEIQRSFLSGLFGGGESNIIDYTIRNNTKHVEINVFSMIKTHEYKGFLNEFMKNIKNMLRKFDIKTTRIKTSEEIYNKMIVSLYFCKSIENVIKFYEEIGFKYNVLRNQESGILIEYLKYRNMCFTKKINELPNNCPENTKYDYFNDYVKISDYINKSVNIEKFINKCKLSNNTIFIPIEKIELYNESNMIADITVEDQSRHDFLANNFLSKNSSMMKQAMGIYVSNFNERFDTLAHVLHYPQKPLVSTEFTKYLKYKELPAGINAIVAIACYGGYNQEDSIIVNKGALDRGIFRSTFFKTYVDQEKEIVRVGGLMEQFEVPNKNETKGIQHGNYNKLSQDGLIEPGSRVIENDIIIGKTTPIATSKQEINQLKKFKKRDISTRMRQNEEGVIDKVLVTTNSDGFRYSKIKIRCTRTPEIGDKLASATKDHEILTLKDGWKNIAEITLEDKVATLVDGKLVYDHPTEVYAYEDYEGDIYEIKNTSIDLRVSGCHKMFVSKRYGKDGIWQPYSFELARNIYGQRRKYKKDAEWDAPDYFFTLPGCEYGKNKEILPDIKFDTIEKMNAWLLFFGIWTAEGWCDISSNNHYNVGICHCKQRVKDVLYSEINKLGFSWSENIQEYPFHKFNIYNKQLAIYLKNYTPGGALTKFLPEWCFQLSKEQTRTLLHGLLLGDGHIQNNCHFYYTSSDKLANQISQLALHAGWSAHNRLRNEGLKEFTIRGRVCHNNHPGWVITIIKTKLHPEINNGHAKNQYAQTEIYIKHIKEPVYCISVPSEVFYIRRNGKCVWTGNSRHGLQLEN